jgi:hypothetical protein
MSASCGRPWLAVVSVCFGAFMGQLDASIVTVAFPDMSRSLHAPVAAVRRAALAYMVTLVALLARWAGCRTRWAASSYGFAVFTAASAGCGLAGLGWQLRAQLRRAAIKAVTRYLANTEPSCPGRCTRSSRCRCTSPPRSPWMAAST